MNVVQGIIDPTQASILKINEAVEIVIFSFYEIDVSDREFEIKNLNSRKANTFNNLPAKLLNDNWESCNLPFYNIINNGINDTVFDEGLKSADITPLHKTGDIPAFLLRQRSLRELYKNRLVSTWEIFRWIS